MRAERLLVVSPGVPHRSQGASSVLFYHYIKYLRDAGFPILNVLLCDPLHEPEEYESILASYRQELEVPGRFEVAVCRSQGFIRRSPFAIRLDVGGLEPLKERTDAFKPDIALCFDLMSAWAAQAVGTQGPRIAWLGDLNFRTGWYHALYGFRENPIMAVKVPLAWLRGHLWRRIYQEVLGDLEAVIVSSKSSEHQLARLGISSRYLPYPWPNEPASESAPRSRPTELPTFILFGNLAALGSRSALHFFIRKLHPKLIEHWGQGGFRIRIAGTRDLPGWARKALEDRQECEFIGFESNLDRLLASCHAMLAPIDVPVGNRSRIVTAMAKGCLVIAHKNAALGNPDLVDGMTCYLAGTAEEFVDCMDAAVKDRRRGEEIVGRAHEVYDRNFRPEVASEMLLKVLEEVI